MDLAWLSTGDIRDGEHRQISSPQERTKKSSPTGAAMVSLKPRGGVTGRGIRDAVHFENLGFQWVRRSGAQHRQEQRQDHEGQGSQGR